MADENQPQKLADAVLDVTKQNKVTPEVRAYLRSAVPKDPPRDAEIAELQGRLAHVARFHAELGRSLRTAERAKKTLVVGRLEDSAAANLAERKEIVGRLRALGVKVDDEFVK